MQDNQEMQDNQDVQQQPSVPNNPPQDISRSSIEDSIKIRLAKEREKHQETTRQLQKKIEELERKFEAGTATSQQSSDYVSTLNKVEQAEQSGIPPEQIPAIIEEHLQRKSLEQKMSEATEKDPELKALMHDPQSLQKISPEELDALKYLPNPAAVFKHLLTNDIDRMTFKATEVDYQNTGTSTAFYQFLGNLSNKLMDSASYPHPPKFKPVPSLVDVGEAETFDTADYIKARYAK